MDTMNHPFQCKSPVFGKDFLGRQKIISGILDDETLSHSWIIGARRSGKTSLLLQLQYIVNNDAKYSKKYVPIYWDMQGIENEDGLRGRLLQDLAQLKRNNKEKFEILGIDFEKAQEMTIEKIFNTIGLSLVGRGGAKLLLLCDEAEELLNIAVRNNQILSVLRHYFQCSWTNTIITATGALWKIKEKDKNVSPFLSGFVPPLYALERLSKDDAITLIRRSGNLDKRFSIPEDWEDQICELTDRMPHYLQLLCKTICETKPSSLDQVKTAVLDHHNWDITLENDLNGLNFIEKVILLCIVDEPGISIQALQGRILEEIGITKSVLYFIRNLQRLCYITETNDHRFTIPNYFLQSWYGMNLDRLIETELANDPDILIAAKKHPMRFGLAMIKFNRLERLIRTYVERQYEIEYRTDGHYYLDRDFHDCKKKSYSEGGLISFNDLIDFLRIGWPKYPPLRRLFRDFNEARYRMDTLYVIKTIRNLLPHPEDASDEEVSALKILSQEMINYFNRIMPRMQ